MDRALKNRARGSRGPPAPFARARLGAAPAGRIIARSRRGLRPAGRPVAVAAIDRTGGFLELDMRLGQFLDKPGRRRRLPEPADPPVEGVVDPGLPAGPGQADIGKSPLFLKSGKAVVVQRALMRKETFLPARQ